MTAVLCHHGIKGQRWGVRRFQNEDGSLTNAGKKQKKELTSEQKAKRKKAIKAIGISSAVTLGTVGAAIGLKKLGQAFIEGVGHMAVEQFVKDINDVGSFIR